MKPSKTILVTGGAGFIGSNFVRYILDKYENYKIIILDALTYAGSLDNIPRDERIEFFFGNVRNASLVDSLVSQSDIVIHFAAETHVTRSIFDNLIFFETDVLGTQCIANSILKNIDRIEKFIHISTSEVYGTALKPSIDEEHALLPLSPYASAKCGADRLVYSYYSTYKIPAVIVRPFNNYGSYQHLEKAVPRFITSCLLNEPLTVHGDGSARRDWLFVEDCCSALDKIICCDIEKIKGEVINLGTGRDISILEIAKMIIQKMDKPESLIQMIDNRPGQVFRHTSSTEKSAKLLSWKPETKFEDGLEKTIKWYQENKKWWEKFLWLRKIPIITPEGKTVYH